MKKITRLLKVSLVCLGLLGLTASVFATAHIGGSVLEAYGLDTVAGYSTVLRTSKSIPNANVIFEVKKPSGEIVTVNAKTSENGVAITDISDYHLKIAGEYRVGARLESSVVNSWKPFVVYPGAMSQTMSDIYPENQVSNVNGRPKPITVSLKDDFGNAIVDHQVKLIGNGAFSEVETLGATNFTNEKGEVSFSVAHNAQGTITYTAYDVTADEVLSSYAKVAYFGSGNSLFQDVSPTFNYAAGNSSGAVDHFKFEDFADKITPGESTSLTLTAYDSNDQTVSNYEGTVRFSVSGANSIYATLPDDYTFDLSDQGSHTFSLAFNFQRIGQYSLKATDLDNIAVFAEEVVGVIESTSLSADVPLDTVIKITNPIAGTYSSNLQVISGKAEPGSGLKIFDNEIEIAQLIADIEGNFSFTTGLLIDGVHEIHVARVDSNGVVVDVSPTVKFTVDTSAPEIGEVTFEPAGEIIPGTAVRVRLAINEKISQAAMILNGTVFDLEDAGNSTYVGAFAAPMDFGDYAVDFVVTDELGNESKYEKYATFKVGSFPVAVKSYPENVINLVVIPDAGRVILEWAAVKEAINPIVRYRVYYGVSPNELTEAVDTFTTATNWYVPNLVNGSTYYFAVVAVDSKGNTSQGFSNIAEATPFLSVIDVPTVDVLEGQAGADALNDLERDVADAGPEVMWLFVLSAIAGYFYSTERRRRLMSDL